MTADPRPSSFPSLPPTFGWRRVVELADEFRVSSADMLAICDRLGVDASDASQWLDAETVDRIRDVVGVKGPRALLEAEQEVSPPKLKVVKPPKSPRTKAEKVPKPPKLSLVEAEPATVPAAMGSVSRDGVRLRRVLAIAVLIAALSLAIGVLVDRWVESVTNTDGPATPVTTVHE